jgi:hypothetical protein
MWLLLKMQVHSSAVYPAFKRRKGSKGKHKREWWVGLKTGIETVKKCDDRAVWVGGRKNSI